MCGNCFFQEATAAHERAEQERVKAQTARLDSLRQAAKTAQSELDALSLAGKPQIDEIAVMVSDGEAHRSLVMSLCSMPGVTLFNTATDIVETMPISGGYMVAYSFLDIPDSPVRLEVMTILSGLSPLHHSMDVDGGMAMEGRPTDPILVHASFKLPTMEAYVDTCNYLEDSTDLQMMQGCTSTYGKFSYWLNGMEGADLYLKPRVNLRDDRGEFGMPGVGGEVPKMRSVPRIITDSPQA